MPVDTKLRTWQLRVRLFIYKTWVLLCINDSWLPSERGHVGLLVLALEHVPGVPAAQQVRQAQVVRQLARARHHAREGAVLPVRHVRDRQHAQPLGEYTFITPPAATPDRQFEQVVPCQLASSARRSRLCLARFRAIWITNHTSTINLFQVNKSAKDAHEMLKY